jgi:hypothetical protein
MFSLRMLLIVVTLCSLYIAGMVFRTPWWEASILTLNYMIFAGSIAAAVLSPSRRAFFVTFAAFGLAYGIAVYLRMELVTTRALEELASRVEVIGDDVQPAPTSVVQTGDFVTIYDTPPSVPELSLPSANAPPPYLRPVQLPSQPDPFADPYGSRLRLKSIGQAFFAVLFGLVMGAIAEIVAKKTTLAAS